MREDEGWHLKSLRLNCTEEEEEEKEEEGGLLRGCRWGESHRELPVFFFTYLCFFFCQYLLMFTMLSFFFLFVWYT